MTWRRTRWPAQLSTPSPHHPRAATPLPAHPRVLQLDMYWIFFSDDFGISELCYSPQLPLSLFVSFYLCLFPFPSLSQSFSFSSFLSPLSLSRTRVCAPGADHLFFLYHLCFFLFCFFSFPSVSYHYPSLPFTSILPTPPPLPNTPPFPHNPMSLLKVRRGVGRS